jgi:DNA-binding transcriptional ArsR family regulator
MITSEIPAEVKRAVKALDNPIRWKIVELLRAKKELSYTELTRSLDVKKGQLTYHINKLLKGAVVQNYSKDGLESKFESFYEISHFGESFVDSLLEPLQSKPLSVWVTGEVLLSPFVTANLSAGLIFNNLKASISAGVLINNIRFPSFRPITGPQSFIPVTDELQARVSDASMLRSILSEGKEVAAPPPVSPAPVIQQ